MCKDSTTSISEEAEVSIALPRLLILATSRTRQRCMRGFAMVPYRWRDYKFDTYQPGNSGTSVLQIVPPYAHLAGRLLAAARAIKVALSSAKKATRAIEECKIGYLGRAGISFGWARRAVGVTESIRSEAKEYARRRPWGNLYRYR